MIAATAICNALPLYTCNPSDFTGVEGLMVVGVPHPGHSSRHPCMGAHRQSRRPNGTATAQRFLTPISS